MVPDAVALKTAWYVIHTQPRAERLAERHLAEQGFRVFVPKTVRTTRHARRVQQSLVPLFPRYIFVTLDLTRDRWYPINGTVGVSRLITAADRPLQLPVGFVEEIIAAGGFVSVNTGSAPDGKPDFRVYAGRR